MIAIAGDVLLMLVLAMACCQVLAPTLARRLRDDRYLHIMPMAAMTQSVCACAAMLTLIAAYAVSDFSLLNVYLNSHTLKPMIYKITGSWGNHEGSILLWMCMFSSLSVLAALADKQHRARTLCVQGWMMAGLAAYVLFTSSPFVQMTPAPEEGMGLNPLLQDIGLAMHPPMLYLGYVGFGVVFMQAVVALQTGHAGRDWAARCYPWIAFSWSVLTAGIGLGAWWAYRELGWGGWWFWDPVENVSLLPWLSGTALLHAAIVLMKRGQMASWTLLLAIVTFTLGLMGTFLVRSGVLISVHSFASDPARGILILLYITLITAAALYYFCRRELQSESAPVPLLSRGGFIALNHLFMLSAAATVLLAIVYPMLLNLLQLGSITVGPPYFQATVLPLMAPAVLLAGIAPLMPWDKSDASRLLRLLRLPALITLTCAALVMALVEHERLLTAAGGALALWLLLTTALMLRKAARTAGGVSAHIAAAALAHGGFAVFVAALTVGGLHSESHSTLLKKGEGKTMGDYRLTLLQDRMGTEKNYAFRIASVRIHERADEIVTLAPELRYYPERAMHTSEAAVASGWLRDVYLASSLQADAKTLGFTLYINPAMRWIWLAFGMVATGGLIAALSRRMKSS